MHFKQMYMDRHAASSQKTGPDAENQIHFMRVTVHPKAFDSLRSSLGANDMGACHVATDTLTFLLHLRSTEDYYSDGLIVSEATSIGNRDTYQGPASIQLKELLRQSPMPCEHTDLAWHRSGPDDDQKCYLGCTQCMNPALAECWAHELPVDHPQYTPAGHDLLTQRRLSAVEIGDDPADVRLDLLQQASGQLDPSAIEAAVRETQHMHLLMQARRRRPAKMRV